MLRSLYIPRLLPLRQKAQANTHQVTARVAVVPDLGPISNSTRLAQYRRKKAILTLNPEAAFPLEVYQ